MDQYLNFKLGNVEVVNKDRFPHLIPMNSCFIRGSVIRYIHLSKLDVDEDLLLDISLELVFITLFLHVCTLQEMKRMRSRTHRNVFSNKLFVSAQIEVEGLLCLF